MELHIIYTGSEILLSKKSYQSWREIQNEYSDFKASLGPWPVPETLEFLEFEYLELDPPAATQVNQFVTSSSPTVVLSFKTVQRAV